jgi:hypothetical protein
MKDFYSASRWKDLQLDVYGSAAPPQKALANCSHELKPTFDKSHSVATVILPDNGKDSDLRIEWAK